MEGFKYVDIFATKGIEYLVAIAFLIILIWFWRWINRPSVAAATQNGRTGTRVSLVDWFRLADDIYYHQGHSWANLGKDGNVYVGIDDFAQKLIGKPAKLHLPEIGTRLNQGEKGLQVEIDGKNIDFLSPVDGEVVALNEKVIQSPEMINQDPYNKGWLIKVKSERFGANIKNLLSGNVARAWIEDTVNKLSTSISGNYGVVLQDGGTITNGFVKELAPDNWEKVAGEFFLTDDI
ncbi:MAG: glycine cleavage system protein H [Calditrichia bacterium]